jgi:type I restriction enzyme, S subunit
MEVRLGYKQTEVGVIPDEWNVKVLPDVCRFRSGKAHERYISKSGRYVCVNSKFISTDGAIRKYSTANFSPAKKGDVLMVMSDLPNGRALAKAYLVEANDTYAVNQRVCALTPYKDCPEYLFYVLNRNPYFLKFDDGVNQTHLLNPIFKKCPLAVPPTVDEQRAIAQALSDADALLAGLDRLIAKKRDLKLAAMQQLLSGQTRLPGFHGEWRMKTFGDLFTFSGGFSASRDQLSSEGHCYLHYGDIHGATNIFVDASTDYQNIPKLDIPLNRVSRKSLLEDGDVVFVDASEDDEGTSRHVIIVNKDKKPFISGLHTIVAKSKTNELVHEYRRYCFQTAAIRQQFLFYAVGTKVSGVSKTNIAKLTMPVPQAAEQTAIAEVLMNMDAELAVLEQRREKTRDLKQAMMQELLTGKTRLA